MKLYQIVGLIFFATRRRLSWPCDCANECVCERLSLLKLVALTSSEWKRAEIVLNARVKTGPFSNMKPRHSCCDLDTSPSSWDRVFAIFKNEFADHDSAVLTFNFWPASLSPSPKILIEKQLKIHLKAKSTWIKFDPLDQMSRFTVCACSQC